MATPPISSIRFAETRLTLMDQPEGEKSASSGAVEYAEFSIPNRKLPEIQK